MPKVSVIVPVYNVEQYLAECLDSIISQTLQDIEIICIDDGSTDNSGKILDDYAVRDGRIRVIHQENCGVSKSRNKAIRSALGEFVMFVDSDDLLPDILILEKLYSKAKENNVLIAGGEFGQFLGNEEPRNYSARCHEDNGYLYVKEGITNYIDYQFDYGFHRFIYNTKFLLENNLEFPEQVYFEDPVFFTRAMYAAKKFYALKEFTYGYRLGHTKPSWNEQKHRDLLLGIETNLEFARQHKLSRLESLTLQRLNEYSPLILSKMTVKNFVKIFLLYRGNFNFYYFYCFKPIIEYIFSLKNEYPNGYKQKILKILGCKFKINNRGNS